MLASTQMDICRMLCVFCFGGLRMAEQEARSIQLWNKKERFLRRKKHEETTPSSAVPTFSETNFFSSSSDEESC